MITTYKVTGMTCGHCVKHVTEEVSQIAGVTDVQVSLDDATMVVTSDNPVHFDVVSAAVAEAGDYTVTPA